MFQQISNKRVAQSLIARDVGMDDCRKRIPKVDESVRAGGADENNAGYPGAIAQSLRRWAECQH